MVCWIMVLVSDLPRVRIEKMSSRSQQLHFSWRQLVLDLCLHLSHLQAIRSCFWSLCDISNHRARRLKKIVLLCCTSLVHLGWNQYCLLPQISSNLANHAKFITIWACVFLCNNTPASLKKFDTYVQWKPWMPRNRQTEYLDRLYYCNSCGRLFLFRSDKEDHTESKGHTSFTIYTLEGKLFRTSDDLPK